MGIDKVPIFGLFALFISVVQALKKLTTQPNERVEKHPRMGWLEGS